MLTPRFLQRITEATEDKTAKLNKYLTQKIIDRILHVYEKTGEVNVNTAALFDALKQQESGRLFDEVVEEIAKKLPEIQDEVRQAFYDSAGKISKDMYLFAQEIVELEDIPDVQLPKVSDWEKIGIPKKAKDLNLTPKEIRLLEAAYKRTNGEIYNITRTTAQASEQTFINACDSAWWKVTHGVSRDEAIMEAIDEVAEKGITTVHYANREEKIEVAIARAVKTGVNQANGDITLTRCAEMGVGYVIVNEHLGARVTKYEDYTNHAHWQGKAYKLNWDNPVLAKYQPTPQETKENAKSYGFLEKIKDFLTGASKTKEEKYKDFIEICGYGKMLGICGINCRHSFNPFYPGININTNKGINTQENVQRYANEQKQRAMERNMRDMKRREEALAYAEKQTDNEEITKRRKELQEKLEKKREEYVDFCAENKLTRESHRLQIAKDYGVSNDVGAGYKEGSTVEKITQKRIDSLKMLKIEGLSDAEQQRFLKAHKDVLFTAMTENDSMEVALMLDEKALPLGDFILGTETSLNLNVGWRGRAKYVIHNHPNNASFSDRDVFWFCDNVCQYFSIVKNNGEIEILCKDESFDKKVITYEYDRLVKKYQKDIDKNKQQGYNKVIEKLITKTKSGLRYLR